LRQLLWALPAIAFVNAFLPLIGFWNGSYEIWYGTQQHLGLLVSGMAAAFCFLVAKPPDWSTGRRGLAAVACVLLGVACFWRGNPERRLRNQFLRAEEIRVYLSVVEAERPDAFAVIDDPEVIAKLADTLAFVNGPYEIARWFTIGGEHEIELLDVDHRRIGEFTTLGNGLGILFRFPFRNEPPRKWRLPVTSDHIAVREFQLAYQSALFDSFMERSQPLDPVRRLYLLKSIGGRAAYEEIAKSATSSDPTERLAVARILRYPHRACVPPLITLASDPEKEIRAAAISSLQNHINNPQAVDFLARLRSTETGDEELDDILRSSIGRGIEFVEIEEGLVPADSPGALRKRW